MGYGSFPFFYDWRIIIEMLSAEEVKKLLLEMIDFASEDIEPPEHTTKDYSKEFIISSSQIINQMKRSKQNSENGKKGGMASAEKRKNERSLEPPLEPPLKGGLTNRVKHNTYTIHKQNNTIQDDEEPPPPTKDEIEKYISEKGYIVNASRFLAYYSVRGWKQGSKSIISHWKSVIDSWQENDIQDKSASNDSSSERKGSFDTDDFFSEAVKRSYGEDYKLQ